ncbi:MAG: hypothetical protein AAGE84_28690 [Cyanobacteria bacterium P01_G01_bin.39]
MSNSLVTLINRLITTVLLVALLFACQQMPENNTEGTQVEQQAN